MTAKKETERRILIETDYIKLPLTWEEIIRIIEIFMYEEIGKEKEI